MQQKSIVASSNRARGQNTQRNLSSRKSVFHSIDGAELIKFNANRVFSKPKMTKITLKTEPYNTHNRCAARALFNIMSAVLNVSLCISYTIYARFSNVPLKSRVRCATKELHRESHVYSVVYA